MSALAIEPGRIVILRALQLGDMLVAVPALRALRRRFPSAEITLIALPWARDFAERIARYVDCFMEFPGWPGIAERDYCASRTAAFLARARAARFDLAIQMHGSGVASNGFISTLGARVTAGYAEPERGHDLDIWKLYPDRGHEIERNLGLARLLGSTDTSTALEFPLTGADREGAERLLAGATARARPLVGVHPGASAPARRWPLAKVARLVDRLQREYGATVVLLGGPSDVGAARELEHRAARPVVNLAGRTSLGELAALIDRLDLYIGNDSGPAHLAGARCTPSVTIFGPVDVERWGPLDRDLHAVAWRPVACSPCGLRECPIDHRCLTWLDVDTVFDLAAGQIERAKVR